MAKRLCPTCHQEYEIVTGMHNWRNLFRKPTVEEWITFFMIVMVIVSYFAYKEDIKNLKEFYESGVYCENLQIINTRQNSPIIDFDIPLPPQQRNDSR